MDINKKIIMEKTAIIILNWNGVELLERFLPSVILYTPNYNTDIIVIDNGSNDDSLELLKSKFQSVRVVELDKNYGFAEGYNRGITHIKGYDYLFFLNSDVEVTKGYLEPLISILKNNDDVVSVQPKVLSYSNKEYFEHAGASGGLIDMFGFPYCRGRIMNRTEKDVGQYNDSCEIFWASGAAMLVRAEVFTSFGGFDKDFFAHMEEIDLAWRLRNKGYKIMVEPKSVVYHVGGGTLPNNSPRKLFLNFRNSLFMLYKNLPYKRFYLKIFIRMSIDGMIAIIYLLTGRFLYFRAVISAHIAFYNQISNLKKKRDKLTIPNHALTLIKKNFVGFINTPKNGKK